MMDSGERAVVDSLKNAARLKWSGLLRATLAGKQVGVIVMHDGQVAWAASTMQSEDFSAVLERVGLVSRDKLTAANQVLQQQRSQGKTANLGSLLAEECLISPSLLRSCFKTHVSAAIASLVAAPLLFLQAEHETVSVDSCLLFDLDDLLPDFEHGIVFSQASSAEQPAGVSVYEAEKGTLLTGLTLLPGYRYSFIADTEGKILTYHVADRVQVQVERIIPKALDWLSAASTLSTEAEMGLVLSAYLHGETGSLFAQMTDFSKQFFVAVSFSADGKLGVIKHKISELIPAVRKFTEVH
ncbi:MAG: hypothetical protein A2X82_00745 [Geobacteraceae bacterium GWC2_55_20]|nr:MAG: hypothetical protein A2X82_00745 [Geobacteraceae bacterium GWC2_55_20]HBA71117.1 hypothetical protein [Geobacter sp.]HCE69214.1 hypothetical protein [Geobacter sp.]